MSGRKLALAWNCWRLLGVFGSPIAQDLHMPHLLDEPDNRKPGLPTNAHSPLEEIPFSLTSPGVSEKPTNSPGTPKIPNPFLTTFITALGTTPATAKPTPNLPVASAPPFIPSSAISPAHPVISLQPKPSANATQPLKDYITIKTDADVTWCRPYPNTVVNVPSSLYIYKLTELNLTCWVPTDLSVGANGQAQPDAHDIWVKTGTQGCYINENDLKASALDFEFILRPCTAPGPYPLQPNPGSPPVVVSISATGGGKTTIQPSAATPKPVAPTTAVPTTAVPTNVAPSPTLSTIPNPRLSNSSPASPKSSSQGAPGTPTPLSPTPSPSPIASTATPAPISPSPKATMAVPSVVLPSPSPSPSATTPSPTPVPNPSPSPSPTPVPSPSLSPSPTPISSASQIQATPSPSSSATPSKAPTLSPSPTSAASNAPTFSLPPAPKPNSSGSAAPSQTSAVPLTTQVSSTASLQVTRGIPDAESATQTSAIATTAKSSRTLVPIGSIYTPSFTSTATNTATSTTA